MILSLSSSSSTLVCGVLKRVVDFLRLSGLNSDVRVCVSMNDFVTKLWQVREIGLKTLRPTRWEKNGMMLAINSSIYLAAAKS